MINRVVLVGRLTKDPEFRTTPFGVSIANFTLAVNRTFTNAQGEREADFINVVVFRKQAENVNNYLFKGNLAGVDGRIQSRTYDNKEGQRVFVTEVVADSVQFLEPKSQSKGQSQQQIGQANPQQAPAKDNPFANPNGPIDITDDDLPF
ncbi:single-stranded DNA-binding protein [Staphylococcus saprophyticus]|uniref:single-stranded DNA-binding protein n=1 Tax=Staphylococcus saprophyticus TaxID=29385 RepID=UPI00065A4727|nr:single-stranded DNA-binding protein [Staphylococcus saprophyticus]MDW3951024.1 single-stranded DNA-binding protein [Staphylococcus saprophyticus]MDW4145986.1 single-stranded DNA-binding protein [Staphylococcus saprophyticus]RXS16698.1 single-stranded DNA-binding protein [Staphylococcus saprophyticus]CRV22898.1 single-stranded DNA-binding protein [Streptococcus equi subsp. equi]